MDNIAFKLESVSFSYQPTKPLLNDISFQIGCDERVALSGSNGSGKSTLLQLMVGLLRPTSGTITAFGQIRNRENDFYEVRKRAGLVFQKTDDQLFCPTVGDDIAFGPLNLQLHSDEVRRRVATSLKLVEMEGFEEQVTWKLSEGQKRRVCIASVMAMDPDILILDEPTADLDQKSRTKLIEILSTCGKGLLLVSHDMDFTQQLCDRILKLESGSICME